MSLFGTGTPNYGALLQGHEKRRRGFINLGLDQINAVYGGGSAATFNQARQPGLRFDPRENYYIPGGKSGQGFSRYWGDGKQPNAVTHPSGVTEFGGLMRGLGDFAGGALFRGIGGLFDKEESPEDIARKAFRRKQLFTKGETENYEGFQPEFYQQRARDYENYALPQLADQYRTNRDAIGYGLSNRGLGGSTVASRAASDLERVTGQGRQQIADAGINQANQLRGEVEASRQEVIRQLYQSADPAQGLQSAVTAAAGLRGPSTFAPLSDLFSNLARSYYVNQTLNNYRQGGGGYGNSTYGLSAPVR